MVFGMTREEFFDKATKQFDINKCTDKDAFQEAMYYMYKNLKYDESKSYIENLKKAKLYFRLAYNSKHTQFIALDMKRKNRKYTERVIYFLEELPDTITEELDFHTELDNVDYIEKINWLKSFYKEEFDYIVNHLEELKGTTRLRNFILSVRKKWKSIYGKKRKYYGRV